MGLCGYLEAVIQGRRAKAERSQIQVRKNGFDDDLQGFTALASDGPACPLEWWTFDRMLVPGFCAFRRKERMRGKPPFPLRIGWAGLSRGLLGQ